MDKIVLNRLRGILGGDAVKTEEPMRLHTTFRIGGPAEVYAVPGSVGELVQTVRLCREYSEPFWLIGKGSNLLAEDGGIRGVVISTERLCRVRTAPAPQEADSAEECEAELNSAKERTAEADSAEECAAELNSVKERTAEADSAKRCAAEAGTETARPARIAAEAGVTLARLARTAKENALCGLEFAAGIPGTLGGAVVMNAGAYGGEMKDVLVSADVLTEDGRIRRLPLEELKLGYRTSCISEKRYIVLEAVLELRPGDPDAIQARMDELASQRRSKQPLEYPSAGSMFKRPPGHFAAKLIDDAGLRGFRVGDAQISEKHCGFVINRGEASADDVLKLCGEVSRVVYEKYGVMLEREVRILGRE